MDSVQHRLLISTRQKSDILLPKGYRRVAGIKSVDGAYIDTGRSTYKIIASHKLRFFPEEGSFNESKPIFGNGDNYITVYPKSSSYQSSGFFCGYGTHFYPFTLNEWHEVELGQGYYTIDGVKGAFNKHFRNNRNNVYLFGRNHNGVTCTDTIIDTYQSWERAYDSDDMPELVRNMVACQRESDGVLGMYDLCGSICPLTDSPFYVNAGTGEFVTEETETLLPPEYQQVEWIESVATKVPGTYIKTSYVANQDSEIEFKFCTTANDAKNIAYGSLFCLGRNQNNQYTFRFNTSALQTSDITQTDFKNLATVKISKEGFFVNDVRASNTISQSDWVDKASINIFASQAPNVSKGIRGADFIVREKGVEKLHLVPCYRKSDDVNGMYDLCGTICPLTGTPFYINSGAGDFLRGDDI